MKTVVAVALSGGVDSTVALHLLCRQRSEATVLVGAMHLNGDSCRCCDSESRRRAEEICSRSGIRFFAVDLVSSFRDTVERNFVETYLSGRTPNPCVICNERIRFDLFYDRLRTCLERGGVLDPDDALRLATGHYARIMERDGRWRLEKGIDDAKDQSYMLYRLKRQCLKNVILPLGGYRKEMVRGIAEKAGLFDVRTGESQDACFVDGNYVEYLRRHLGGDVDRPGDIVSTEGSVMGRHRGYLHYTVGQRKALGLGTGPWYVVAVDAPRNRIVVGRRDDLRRRIFEVEDVNWLADPPAAAVDCRVKVRYRSVDEPCRLTPRLDGGITVEWEGETGVTPGQSAVFYDGDRVLGGGIIC